MIDIANLRAVADQAKNEKAANELVEFEKKSKNISRKADIIALRIIDNLETILQNGSQSGQYEICIFNYGSSMDPTNDIERLIMCEHESCKYGDRTVDLGEKVLGKLSDFCKVKGYELVLWRKKSSYGRPIDDSELKINFQLRPKS